MAITVVVESDHQAFPAGCRWATRMAKKTGVTQGVYLWDDRMWVRETGKEPIGSTLLAYAEDSGPEPEIPGHIEDPSPTGYEDGFPFGF